MITIGQLAAHADVTVRAVRHYHAKGLLPEPERDASGYRRYDAQAVVDLIKIRTLVDAGVPLARVEELLHADEEEFSAAVAEIDKRLRAEIRERKRHREQIARLAVGDNLALPPEAVEYLGRLREVGASQRMIEAERDGWILIAAHSPDRMTSMMEFKLQELEDPDVAELYQELDAVIDWQPDDPRLPALADRLAATIAKSVMREKYDSEDFLDGDLVELMDAFFLDSVPIGRRLMELLEERGWTGWTQFKPTSTTCR